jgi:hypothetical protein
MSTGADTHPLPAHLLCAALVAVALFFLASCKDNPVKPVINNAPVITQQTSPLQGTSPLEVKLKVSATDPDGIGDIASYKTVVRNNFNSDSLVLAKNPTDTTLTFTTPSGIEKAVYNIKSTAVDKKGAKDSKETNVEVYQPMTYIYQKATLQNKVDINYQANIKNLNEPRLDVSKNGSVILSRTIKEPSYSEVFSYSKDTSITQGNYGFALKGKTPAGKDTSNTTFITIPNYAPEINFSDEKADMDEGGEIILDLKSKIENSDPNPENNPIEIRKVVPLDDKTEVSFSGYNVKIKSLEDKVGDYQVRVDVGNDKAGESSAVVKDKIYDLLDIRNGVLEDNEQHSRQAGIVKVYNGNSVEIGEIAVDNSGQFNKKFNKRIADLADSILIQGRKIDPLTGQEQSYIRTIKLPRRDVNGLEMVVVPYDGLSEMNATPEQFRQFMYELNLNKDELSSRFDLDGTLLNNLIPGFKGLEGIEILSENPYGVQFGTFISEKQDQIKGKILDENDINGIIGDYRIKPEQISIGNNPAHFTLDSTVMGVDSNRVIPNEGWIIVVPRTDIRSGGATVTYQKEEKMLNGTFSRGTIYLNPSAIIITSHEFGHLFIAAGHPTSLYGKSVMANPVPISTTGPADKKAGKIIYEPTYMIFPQIGYPHVDDLENLLGFKWADQ